MTDYLLAVNEIILKLDKKIELLLADVLNRKRAKLREVEAMESSVIKKFDYVKNLQAVCRAEPTPAGIMVILHAVDDTCF